MAAKWPANGAAKAAEPRTSSRACEEEFRARREAIAKALDASPLESKLKWQAPAYRARDIGLWSHELATAGFDRAGVQKLIALDAEKANEPGALLGRWLRRGAGHCRDVIGEPGMKDRQAVGVQRMLDFDAARPADQVARGEPAGFGVTPLLAGSVLASAVLRLAHGGST